MVKYKGSYPEAPHILPKMTWITKDFLLCLYTCTGHIILHCWNFFKCVQGRSGRPITHFVIEILLIAGSKATDDSVLFPEEDKSLLQALHCFHVLIRVNGWIGVIEEPNKNFSWRRQDALSFILHSEMLTIIHLSNQVHLFRLQLIEPWFNTLYISLYWTMWPLWFLVDSK